MKDTEVKGGKERQNKSGGAKRTKGRLAMSVANIKTDMNEK